MPNSKAPQAYEVNEFGGTPEQEAYMRDIIDQFTIDSTYLNQIREHFMVEMEKGLQMEGATIAMIPSYVEGRLTGQYFFYLDAKKNEEGNKFIKKNFWCF
jgi:hypothetical protein